MIFSAFGHENITSNHKITLEVTKERNLTKRGDCVVGVNSDFNFLELKKFVEENNNCVLTLTVLNLVEEICGKINKTFCDKQEIVLRKTGFISDRTLMINCDRAACDLDRDFVKKINNSKQKIYIELKPV